MGIMDFLFGSKEKNIKQSTLTGGQENVLNQLVSQLTSQGGIGNGVQDAMSLLQGFLNPESEQYKNFEAPYMQQFNQQTVPGLAERFAGMGAMGGGLSSSGFGQALSSAGGNLQTELARMKSGMQRQAAGDIFGQYNQMSNQALGTRAFENQYQPGQGGLVQSLASGIGSGFGMGGGLGMANYVGKLFGGY